MAPVYGDRLLTEYMSHPKTTIKASAIHLNYCPTIGANYFCPYHF